MNHLMRRATERLVEHGELLCLDPIDIDFDLFMEALNNGRVVEDLTQQDPQTVVYTLNNGFAAIETVLFDDLLRELS